MNRRYFNHEHCSSRKVMIQNRKRWASARVKPHSAQWPWAYIVQAFLLLTQSSSPHRRLLAPLVHPEFLPLSRCTEIRSRSATCNSAPIVSRHRIEMFGKNRRSRLDFHQCGRDNLLWRFQSSVHRPPTPLPRFGQTRQTREHL